ncbi:MAG: DUF493 domain-containing protein [Zetaproteobacteria bacterium]|nr:DUF493 domain-containing protein [Zetaproteobacteria bacterium]
MPLEELISFPCTFAIKVTGINGVDFVKEMVAIVAKFDPVLTHEKVSFNLSRSEKYMALTMPVQATSREQLDAIYRTIHAHPHVKFML